MSLGCASRRGAAAPRRRRADPGGGERAAARRARAGHGARARRRWTLARELVAADRGAAGDRRRRPQRPRRAARAARPSARARPCSPRTRASSGGCSRPTPSEVAAQRLGVAREAAARGGAIVVLKGDDTIVTDGERVAVNAVGAPRSPPPGTGDVLAGMIGGAARARPRAVRRPPAPRCSRHARAGRGGGRARRAPSR